MRNAAAILFLLFATSALPAERKPANFLWLSDIHLDPLADPELAVKLLSAPSSEWAGIFEKSSHRQFPQYGQDTTPALFNSLLTAVKSIQAEPAFVVVTGDLLAHHFKEKFESSVPDHNTAAYRQFVRKTIEFVGNQLTALAPEKPLFVALGNNDDECGDYLLQPNGPFLNETEPLYRSWARVSNDPQFSRDWRALGSYSAPHPLSERTRLIVLNTGFLSAKYKNGCGQSPEDPGNDVLDWLERQIAGAKHQHKKAWLIFHIPPGIDGFATAHSAKATPAAPVLFWKPEYLRRFNQLLQSNENVMEVSLAGHTHVDDFRVWQRENARNLVLIGPGVTPIYNQNPAFRLVTVDSQGKLADISTYFLTNLDAAGGQQPAKWELEYSFDQLWKAKRPDYSAVRRLWLEAGRDSSVREKWMKFYSVEHAGPAIAADNFAQLYCASGNTDVSEYERCVSATRVSISSK